MNGPRWLIVLGLLLGSFVIMGSAQVLKAYRLDKPSNASSELSINEAMVADCMSNAHIPEAVRLWCEPIVEQASQHQLDPTLVAAVIEVESGGTADAVSRSGAVGLMQIMPRDGLASQFQCINGPCFANRPSMAELVDPVYNIQYGSSYLSGLINRYGGDPREALNAYGPREMDYRYADLVLSVYQSYTQ
jgi:hypothetical protein